MTQNAKAMDESKNKIQELQAQIEALRGERKQLLAEQGIVFKVSEKGAVSCYLPGRRFPVTLYGPEMLALLDKHTQIREFIEANRTSLSWEKAAKATEDDKVNVG